MVMVQGVGFEPTNSERADLQSAVFDRFTNPADNIKVRLTYLEKWSHLRDSNPGPAVYKTAALTS